MTKLSSPVLLFGDPYLCKNDIIAVKQRDPQATWVTMSLTDDSPDKIRMEAGTASWDDSEKVIILEELPNRKQIREFVLDLVTTLPSLTKLIVWDSKGTIKINPKTRTLDKTWSEFVAAFKKIDGSKVINNGGEITDKTKGDCIPFIQQCFAKHKKNIGIEEARLLVSIVGYRKGMLQSDIDKMSLTSPETVTSDFILENAFPSSKEAIIYKLSNVLDTLSYEASINMMDRFLGHGINENVIADTIVKKARWQMAAVSLWIEGMTWDVIATKLSLMGKFPSCIWHNPKMNSSNKKKESEIFQDEEGMLKYLTQKEGYPRQYFKITVPSKNKVRKSKKNPAAETTTQVKKKRAEAFPMPFMANQTVDFVKTQIVRNNSSNTEEERQEILDRAINVYLFCQDKLAQIRYGKNPVQDLQEMVRAITNVNVEVV